jgi:hypothetical protein
MSVSVGMATTLTGQWEPPERLRRELAGHDERVAEGFWGSSPEVGCWVRRD